jgi:hypothetical protein
MLNRAQRFAVASLFGEMRFIATNGRVTESRNTEEVGQVRSVFAADPPGRMCPIAPTQPTLRQRVFTAIGSSSGLLAA